MIISGGRESLSSAVVIFGPCEEGFAVIELPFFASGY